MSYIFHNLLAKYELWHSINVQISCVILDLDPQAWVDIAVKNFRCQSDINITHTDCFFPLLVKMKWLAHALW